jgi:Double-GTPase 2
MEAFLVVVLALLYVIYLACAIPISAIVAFAAYSVGLPVTYFVSTWRVLVVRPPSLPSPRRGPKIPAGSDPAVLQYFYGPALVDAEHAARVAYGSCRDLWQRGAQAVTSSFHGDRPLLTGPMGAGGAIGMIAGTAVGTVAAAGCALIQLLAVAVSAAAVRAAGAALRAADSAVLRIKNIRMVCPNCYKRVPYPAYECPGRGCHRRHRDVRPGRFGIIRRRCQCGARLKTLLLFGSSRMNAYCPYCGYSLEHRPGEAPEIVLPFFGATGAGKTRLLFSMVVQLQMWSHERRRESAREDPSGRRPSEEKAAGARPVQALAKEERERFAIEFGDSTTTRKLESAGQLLSPETATDKTPPELPQAYIIRLSSRHGTRILHMFDAAGELFYTPERTQELRYLDKAKTFILVVDPLSVEAFWDRLLPDQQAELKPVRSAAPSPDLAYQQAHQEIEAMGVQLSKTRLAVVFSRADLIGTAGDDVAAWASDELGLGNLVRSARLNFREACFFHTAAVMVGGVMHESIPTLMRWVLGHNGIELS